MRAHQYLNLRINRVDTAAAKQSGLPVLFYTIKRCYGDDEASSYLRAYGNSQSVVLIAVGEATRSQMAVPVLRSKEIIPT